MFDELAGLPGTKEVFGPHNPIRELPNWLSGDAGGELLRFFQKIDANTGALVHDFTDPAWDTRFLGDLYQDLSEAARKKYALLQTPEFVEEFILDRTLEPALKEFGLASSQWSVVGRRSDTDSGMTLQNDRPRLRQRALPAGELPPHPRALAEEGAGTNTRELVQRTLDSIHGVDINPYAVAIARFRLLLAAMQPRGSPSGGCPAFHNQPRVSAIRCCTGPGGDSRLWAGTTWTTPTRPKTCRCFSMLKPGRYHAVVANPPYITPKDRALNEEYRTVPESAT